MDKKFSLSGLEQMVPSKTQLGSKDQERLGIIASAIQSGCAGNVPTKDLNVNGIGVKDSMNKYLENNANSSGLFKVKALNKIKYNESEIGIRLKALKSESTALFKGTNYHTAVLEKSAYSRMIVEPKYSRASTDGVNILIDFYSTEIEKRCVDSIVILDTALNDTNGDILKLKGKKEYLAALIRLAEFEVIKEETSLEIEALKQSIDDYSNGIIWSLLKYSKRETSFYWTDPNTGLKFKVRPDSIQFEENIGLNAVISVKTTRRNSIEDYWRYDFFGFGYDLGEAYYQDIISNVTGRKFDTTLMIVLQTVAPFDCAVLVVPDDVILSARKRNQARIIELIEAKKTGLYSSWVDHLVEDGGIVLLD